MTTNESSELRQFDFWLGEWDLTWGETGRGTNRITAVLDNRVIQEEFDGTPSTPLQGLSVSTYNITQSWGSGSKPGLIIPAAILILLASLWTGR